MATIDFVLMSEYESFTQPITSNHLFQESFVQLIKKKLSSFGNATTVCYSELDTVVDYVLTSFVTSFVAKTD